MAVERLGGVYTVVVQRLGLNLGFHDNREEKKISGQENRKPLQNLEKVCIFA